MKRIVLALVLTVACGVEKSPDQGPPRVQVKIHQHSSKPSVVETAYQLGRETVILERDQKTLETVKDHYKKEIAKEAVELAGLQDVAFIVNCLEAKVGKKKANKIVDNLERWFAAPELDACKKELQILSLEEVEAKVSEWVKKNSAK